MSELKLRVDLETAAATSQLTAFRSHLASFTQAATRSISIGIKVNTQQASAELATWRASQNQALNMRVSLDTLSARAALQAFRSSVLPLSLDVRLNAAGVLAQLAAIRASLNSQSTTIRVSLEAQGTEQRIDDVRQAITRLSGTALTGAAALRVYGQALEGVRRSAEDAARAINDAINAANNFGGNLNNFGNQETAWGRLRRQVVGVATEYQGLAAKLLVVKSSIAVLTASVVGATPAIAGFAAASGMAFGTVLATTQVAAMSKELESLHRSTGISKQSLQEWRLAARFEGIEAELSKFGDMANVFNDVDAAIAQLGTKDGEGFAATLKQIGLSADELRGKKVDEALLIIGDAFNKSGLTEKQKENLLASITADAGKLLPLLQQNAVALNEVKAYANAVGAIQSDAQLAAMKQTNIELSYMKLGLEGVMVQLSAVGSNAVNTLGPNIRQLFIDARQPIDAWSQAAGAAVAKFKIDLDSTGSWAEAFKLSFQSIYPTLYQFLGSAADLGRGYGEAFITPMIAALKKGYASISTALGEAGGANAMGAAIGEGMRPIIGIVESLSKSIVLVTQNWEQLTKIASYTPVGFVVANWDKVTAAFESVGNGIRKMGEAFGLLNPATTSGVTGVQVFMAALGGLLVTGATTRLALGAIGAAFATIGFAIAPVTAIISAAPALWGAFAAALGVVRTALLAVAAAAMANPVIAAVTAVAAVTALIYANWDKVGPYFKAVWEGVKSTTAGAWESIKTTTVNAWQGVKAATTTAWEGIKGSTKTALDGLKSLFPTAFGAMQTTTKAATQAMSGDFKGAWDTIKKGAADFARSLGAQFNDLAAELGRLGGKIIDGMVTAVRAGFSRLKEAGAYVIDGITEGIRLRASAAVDAVQDVSSKVANKVKGFFGIQSPSRLMMEYGSYLSEGFGLGIAENADMAITPASRLANDVSQAISNGLFSGDWKSAGQSLLNSLKSAFIDPLKQSLSSAISQAISGGAQGGGLLGSIGKIFNFSGINSALSGVGSSVGGLFSGIATSAASGFAGIGTAITGGLSGIMGSFGTLVSAIPGWGWAIAGLGALSKLFGDPKATIRLTQGARDGQGMLTDGQQHYTKTALGTVGATDASYKIGREKDFVPKLREWFGWVGQFDAMIAQALPNSVKNISHALTGIEMSGADLQSFTKQRMQVIFSAIPDALQSALAGGKDFAKLTADEMAARFTVLSQVVQSGLSASLQNLGVNLGTTNESALAAAIGLTDLMGGIDKVKEASSFYYQEFFSDEQRKAIALKQASADVVAFNRSLGLTGSAAINSHAEFVKYVSSLDLTSEAGRKAYAAAMAVAGSVDIVADAYKAKVLVLQQALPALENLNLRIGSTGNSALTAVNGLASLMGGIDNLTKAANTYYDQFFTDEEKKKQALANVAADVDRFNKTLGLSGKNAIDTHAEFKKYIESLDLQTESGRKAYAEAMKIVGSMDALADTGKSLDDVIGSLPKKLYAKALAMAGLSDAVDKAATGSTDALNDVKRSMGGLGTAAGKTAQAIEEFVNKALKAAGLLNTANPTAGKSNNNGGVDGSHADGLNYVPKDGYIAELHKGEMVLTARQSAAYKAGAGQSMTVSVRPQLSIVVNNNANASVNVTESTDAAGNTTATLTIEGIESAIADRARRGKGLAGTFTLQARR